MAGKKIWELALKALPHLAKCAQEGNTITYGDLGERIGASAYYVVPKVLGCIRDEICRPNNLPWLTAIVVSKNSGVPGESFVAGSRIEDTETRRQKAEEKQAEVFSFGQWNEELAPWLP